MACVTIKRSLDFDPFGCNGRTPKRRRCAPLTVSPQAGNKISSFELASPKISADSIASSVRDELRRLHRRRQLPATETDSSGSDSETSPQLLQSMSSAPSKLLPTKPGASRDKPLFNFKEVGMICERILREREDHIREEYDKVLSAKLQEQYDMFVRFTQDQIVKNFEHSHSPSYLS